MKGCRRPPTEPLVGAPTAVDGGDTVGGMAGAGRHAAPRRPPAVTEALQAAGVITGSLTVVVLLTVLGGGPGAVQGTSENGFPGGTRTGTPVTSVATGGATPTQVVGPVATGGTGIPPPWAPPTGAAPPTPGVPTGPTTVFPVLTSPTARSTTGTGTPGRTTPRPGTTPTPEPSDAPRPTGRPTTRPTNPPPTPTTPTTPTKPRPTVPPGKPSVLPTPTASGGS